MAEKNHPVEFSNRIFVLIIIFVALLSLFWSFRIYEIWKTSTGNYPREITVEGEGKALVTPDLAMVNVGVSSESATSAQAIADNTKKMNAVIKVLKDLGIDEKNIQTTQYSLSPKYNFNDQRGSFIDGYTISQNVQVKVKDFKKLSDILAKTTDAGANIIGGVDFTVEDKEKAKTEARKNAIAKAKESANQISETTGLKLGKVLNFYEYVDSYGGKGGMMIATEEMSKSEGPILEPGQEEITLRVNLTYRIY